MKYRKHLQRSVWSLYQIAKNHNLKISINKTKVVAFQSKQYIRAKLVIQGILEQVHMFNYLGCNISYLCSNDPELKIPIHVRHRKKSFIKQDQKGNNTNIL